MADNQEKELKKAIIKRLEDSDFIKNMELEFLELSTVKAVGRIPFKKKFLNPYGSVHGGFLYSLADTVAGSLASMCGNYCTTSQGGMNFFEPAVDTKYVYCNAFVVRNGKHLVNIKVEIRDDRDTLLDDASFNYFKLKKEKVLKD